MMGNKGGWKEEECFFCQQRRHSERVASWWSDNDRRANEHSVKYYSSVICSAIRRKRGDFFGYSISSGPRPRSSSRPKRNARSQRLLVPQLRLAIGSHTFPAHTFGVSLFRRVRVIASLNDDDNSFHFPVAAPLFFSNFMFFFLGISPAQSLSLWP